jgi:hypothetical protein
MPNCRDSSPASRPAAVNIAPLDSHVARDQPEAAPLGVQNAIESACPL